MKKSDEKRMRCFLIEVKINIFVSIKHLLENPKMLVLAVC